MNRNKENNEVEFSQLIVHVKKKGNLYYLFIPELSIIVSSQSIEKGYGELKKKWKQQASKFEKLEELGVMKRMADKDNLSLWSELTIFGLKVLIFLFLTGLILAIASPLILRTARQMANDVIMSIQ